MVPHGSKGGTTLDDVILGNNNSRAWVGRMDEHFVAEWYQNQVNDGGR